MICGISKHLRIKVNVKKTMQKGIYICHSSKAAGFTESNSKKAIGWGSCNIKYHPASEDFLKDKQRVCSFLLTQTRLSRQINHFFPLCIQPTSTNKFPFDFGKVTSHIPLFSFMK